MKKLLLAVTIILGLAFMSVQPATPPEPSPTPIDFVNQDLVVTHTPIEQELWVFTADWCHTCRKYKPTLKEAEKRGIKVRYINTDNHPELVKQYNITTIPTTLVMHDNEEMGREEGNITIIAIFNLLRDTLRTFLPKLLNIILVMI